MPAMSWSMMRIACIPDLILNLLQLAASGERERLKALLRDRLVECGWKEDVARHARGANPGHNRA